MAFTTSDSLPSSPSLPNTAALDVGADQEFSSQHHGGLFLPCSSSYLDSSFHGLLATNSASSTPMPPPPHPSPQAPSKPPKKRPRASRRPPTTVLTTDTSNFRPMVQEFTGFPAPPFASSAPTPAVRPRLLPSAVVPPFLLWPSPLKYPLHSPLLPLPSTCTTTAAAGFLANAGGATGGSSSLVDALALFAKSSAPAATSGGSGGADDDQYHHHGMGGFNPFDDFAAAEGAKAQHGGGHGFFSPLGAGDKYDRH